MKRCAKVDQLQDSALVEFNQKDHPDFTNMPARSIPNTCRMLAMPHAPVPHPSPNKMLPRSQPRSLSWDYIPPWRPRLPRAPPPPTYRSAVSRGSWARAGWCLRTGRCRGLAAARRWCAASSGRRRRPSPPARRAAAPRWRAPRTGSSCRCAATSPAPAGSRRTCTRSSRRRRAPCWWRRPASTPAAYLAGTDAGHSAAQHSKEVRIWCSMGSGQLPVSPSMR